MNVPPQYIRWSHSPIRTVYYIDKGDEFEVRICSTRLLVCTGIIIILCLLCMYMSVL